MCFSQFLNTWNSGTVKPHRLFFLSKIFIFALRSPSSVAKMAKNGPYNVQIQIQMNHHRTWRWVQSRHSRRLRTTIQSTLWPQRWVGWFTSCFEQQSFSNDPNLHASLSCSFSKWKLKSPTTVISPLPSLSERRKSGIKWIQRYFVCTLILFAVRRSVQTNQSEWNTVVHDTSNASKAEKDSSFSEHVFLQELLIKMQNPTLWLT